MARPVVETWCEDITNDVFEHEILARIEGLALLRMRRVSHFWNACLPGQARTLILGKYYIPSKRTLEPFIRLARLDLGCNEKISSLATLTRLTRLTPLCHGKNMRTSLPFHVAYA